jgi:mannose-1-phosphate guanylyltransferase/mannose-6-phosphate isomerase
VVGLDNVIVVTTPDAVLVAGRSAGQRVKDLVGAIERRDRRLVDEPW